MHLMDKAFAEQMHIYFQYSKIKSSDQNYQMSQFSQVELNPDKEIKNNLKVELKNENYETELATQDLETKLQSQNQKLLEKSNDFDIQENQINLSQAREFIQNIPNLDPKMLKAQQKLGSKLQKYLKLNLKIVKAMNCLRIIKMNLFLDQIL